VDEGSSLHNTTEPRFRGSNIPSRAFRTLQNNLPPGPDIQEQSPSFNFPAEVKFPQENQT